MPSNDEVKAAAVAIARSLGHPDHYAKGTAVRGDPKEVLEHWVDTARDDLIAARSARCCSD